MTDDERIAEFMGWTRCPGEHLLIGTKTCEGWLTASGSHTAYVPELDGSPYGWMAFGELVAAIEAKGWLWACGSDGFDDQMWAWVNNLGISRADNIPEALKLATLAALEAE